MDSNFKHDRRSTRLKHYDYSLPGAYFVTLCTYNRQCLLGKIVDGKMQLNKFGEIIHSEWHKTAELRHNIKLDEFTIMPNHIHGLIHIVCGENVGTRRAVSLQNQYESKRNFGGLMSDSLHTIVGSFKSAVTKKVHEIAKIGRIWQPRFFEHVIRNERELYKIRWYIKTNPKQWEIDRENPRFL